MRPTNTIFLILLAIGLVACGGADEIPTAVPVVALPAAEGEAAEIGAGSADEASTGEASGQLSETEVASLDNFMQSLVFDEGDDPAFTAPGVILLVDTPDGRYLRAAGVSSLEEATPIQVDDRVEIGSNSKSFLTVILMQLQEEGILSFDDSLSQWLPEQAQSIPNGEAITLRQLANHTAGVWDYGDPLIGEAADNSDKLELGYTPEELVQYAVDNGTPDFAPGEGWNYSNTGYILLGMVAEQATGQSLSDILQERIFDPLQLESAGLIEGVPEEGEIVDGYWWREDGTQLNTTNWNVSQGWAAGGIAMTAEDLATYGEALASGKLLQSPDSLTELLTFVPGETTLSLPYGLGLLQLPDGSWGHEGQTAGFQTFWMTNPETGVTVVGLSNSAAFNAFSFLQAGSFVESDGGSGTNSVGLPGDSVEFCAVFDLPFPHPEPDYDAKRPLDFSPFAEALDSLNEEQFAGYEALLGGLTILEIQELLAGGDITSEGLVTYYLARIQRYDVDRLNAVIELNPEALSLAQALDQERAGGAARGPLHGIPVLLKDNIATGDQMHTTAGSFAMQDWQPERDAFLVSQLRAAGAVILGKANLSQWANFMDPCLPNGFTTLGGQTRNPYGPYETLGSSSGSAAAVAANLAAASVGSETQGSIIAPAGINSVVGLKTSRGLVSRDNIVPLLVWQDVPGPIGRNVTDVAVMLTAMTGVDENDAATADAAEMAGVDFTQFLTREAAQSVRVGLPVFTDAGIEAMFADLDMTTEQIDSIRQSFIDLNIPKRELAAYLIDSGVEVVEVEINDVPTAPDLGAVLDYGFRDGVNQFLADRSGSVPVATLAEIIEINLVDMANRAPYGQDLLEDAHNSELTADEYAELAASHQVSATTELRAYLQDNEIDVLMDTAITQAYAPAGFPALTVPIGYDAESGQPKGVTFLGDFLSEPQLLAVGYLFEQASQLRVEPDLDKTMEEIDGIR